MKPLFEIINAESVKVPIVVSIPHCGRIFPPELATHYKQELAKNPDDTDFFVDKLYDFLPKMGITTICANYSRWVIDLNRSPKNEALYNDGRIITNLTPTTDFFGNAIYANPVFEPKAKEVERRKKLYFQPYYDKITSLLAATKQQFGKAILWDAHSIRRTVPTIQTAPFPDLILGTNDGQTADNELIAVVKNSLGNSPYDLSYNHPFKGGNITRYFGNPSEHIYAFQLEMAKDLYMDDTETQYHPERAAKMKEALIATFEELIRVCP
ncbi:MAG: N-formylglutamate amidohydrolase [Saprospiraceae bacterium]